ncbi:MAG: MurR/RpiR family transcriptional regulator [Christensenellaceae bacterium]|nr:MurR/RpiR family transcriptional regulator [Christensenellaceae bacterium]
MDNNNVLAKIENSYPSFSKRQKLIADYILKNYDKAAFMTANALSAASGVSESTVVRFAYALGFDGYPKLQKKLQETIKIKLTNVQRMNLMDGMDTFNVFETVLKMDIANIKATRDQLDADSFKKAAECLIAAKRIYVIGYRSSSPLAQFAVYYLNYIFDNVRLVSAGASDIYAQLMHAGHDDVVMAIGFPRYASQTVDGARFAKSNGATVISVTDNELSPLYELGDMCLLARTEMTSFVDSLVAPMSVINALVVMIGLLKKEQVQANFATVEKIWNENDVYVRPDADIVHLEDRNA